MILDPLAVLDLFPSQERRMSRVSVFPGTTRRWGCKGCRVGGLPTQTRPITFIPQPLLEKNMISLLPLAENKQITRSASKALGHTNTLGPDLRAGRELQSPIAREEPEELDSNRS